MTQIIMNHGVSACFGTSLAPLRRNSSVHDTRERPVGMDTRNVVDRHAVVGGEPSADIEVSSPVEHWDDGDDPGIKRRFGSQTRFVKRRHQGAVSIQPQQPKLFGEKNPLSNTSPVPS